MADAKFKALSLVSGYQPPVPPEFSLPHAQTYKILSEKIENLLVNTQGTIYDREIFKHLAFVVTGGVADMPDEKVENHRDNTTEDDVNVITEDQLYGLELNAFTSLVKNPKTRLRIEHMLKTGKPLKN